MVQNSLHASIPSQIRNRRKRSLLFEIKHRSTVADRPDVVLVRSPDGLEFLFRISLHEAALFGRARALEDRTLSTCQKDMAGVAAPYGRKVLGRSTKRRAGADHGQIFLDTARRGTAFPDDVDVVAIQ